MRALYKQLTEAKTGHEQTLLQRHPYVLRTRDNSTCASNFAKLVLREFHWIDATDKQIDKLVYELYELTEEEIKIVEGQ